MSFKDLFDVAEVLDSLAWLGMSDQARTAKLANIYLREWESRIDNRCRSYYSVEERHLPPFIKHYFKPARGHQKREVAALMAEIPRQKKIIRKRERNKPLTEKQLLRTLKPERRSDRRNAVAPRIYSVSGDSPNCVAITRFAGHRLTVEGGCYNVYPRVHTTNLETGEVKCFVLKGKETVKSVNSALMRMVPKGTTRKAFSGSVVTFDFDAETLTVDGVSTPLRVRHVYRGPDEVFGMKGRIGEN